MGSQLMGIVSMKMYSQVCNRCISKHIHFVIGQKLQLVIVLVLIAKHRRKCLRRIFGGRQFSVGDFPSDRNDICRVVKGDANKMLVFEMKSVNGLSSYELHLHTLKKSQRIHTD